MAYNKQAALIEYQLWRKTYYHYNQHGGKLQTGSTKRDLSKLAYLWFQDISTTALCERFGCSTATLYRHVRALHLPLRGHRISRYIDG
jgi:hypothetical protein